MPGICAQSYGNRDKRERGKVDGNYQVQNVRRRSDGAGRHAEVTDHLNGVKNSAMKVSRSGSTTIMIIGTKKR